MITFNSQIVSRSTQQTDIGNRIVLLGTATKGDKLNYTPTLISSEFDFRTVYGDSSDLYNAYVDMCSSGTTSAYILKIDSTIDKTSAIINGITAIVDWDFDICVITNMLFDSEYSIVSQIVDIISNKSLSKLFFINTSKAPSDNTIDTWKNAIYNASNIVYGATLDKDGLENICVIADNVVDDINCVASYMAGLIVLDYTKHPTRLTTSFTDVYDICSTSPLSNVACFKKTRSRGIVITNFETLMYGKYQEVVSLNASDVTLNTDVTKVVESVVDLHTNINGTSTLICAYNIYLLNIIVSSLKQVLNKYAGSSINDSKQNISSKTSPMCNDIENVLDSFVTDGTILAYNYGIITNRDSLRLDIKINLQFTYNVENINVDSITGV